MRQSIPVRVGGFGGPAGLERYLTKTRIQLVIDATHPFASRISANAAQACARLGVPIATFTRPAWQPLGTDRWTRVPDITAAAVALGPVPRRVFVTTGRLELGAYRAAPQHRYLIRTIDPPNAADLPPDHQVILARGPFEVAAEMALMRDERVEVLVTKNSGGEASFGKIVAARTLRLPVVMIERPNAAGRAVLTALPEVMGWIAAHRGASELADTP